MSLQSELARAGVKRDAIEGVVWTRNPDAIPPDDLERRRVLLSYLMTKEEWTHWFSITSTIEEMRKHLP